MPITKTIIIDANTKNAQKELDQINAMLEQQDENLDKLEKTLRDYEKQLDKTNSRDLNKRKQIQESINKTKKLIKEEKQDIKENTKARKKANQALDEAKENAGDLSGVMQLADKATGGLASSLLNVSKGTEGVVKGAKSMKIALAATGIGLIVIAIGSLATAFSSSEEGQNKFAKIMTKIGVIVGNVTDIVADFGMGIFNAGKAMAKLITGDFAGATAAFAEMTININEATDGIKNFGEETAKEMKLAGQLADQRAKADKIDRDLLLERAEANRRFNELREKAADKENVSIEDRIAALKEAGRIDEEITKKEIEAARLRFEAKKLENSLSKSTKEDLDEQAKLEAELINLETARLKKAKTLTAEITTNLREAESERKAAVAKEKADQKVIDDEKIKKEKELATLKKQIRDAEAVSEDDARALKLQKIDEYYQTLIDKATAAGIATDDLEAARNEKKNAQQAEFDTKDDDRKQKTIDDAQAQADELKAIEDQKKAQQMATFDNAVALAGEETKLGKALLLAKQIMLAKEFIINAKEQMLAAKTAVTKATVNAAEASTETTSSVAKAANTAPPPFNIPFILTAIATGASVLSAVKSAVGATKSAAASVGGSGGGSVSTPTPITPAAAPPAFNVVGQGATSQLAEAIGGQAPTRAYVVSNDVTTAQGLERNIVEGATI